MNRQKVKYRIGAVVLADGIVKHFWALSDQSDYMPGVDMPEGARQIPLSSEEFLSIRDIPHRMIVGDGKRRFVPLEKPR